MNIYSLKRTVCSNSYTYHCRKSIKPVCHSAHIRCGLYGHIVLYIRASIRNRDNKFHLNRPFATGTTYKACGPCTLLSITVEHTASTQEQENNTLITAGSNITYTINKILLNRSRKLNNFKCETSRFCYI